MARRCDRPACSEPAAVAYGFDAAGRQVWLDRMLDEDRARSGALCLRHAQRLTAPRGWWLDDRRVAVPELFRDGETPVEPTVESAKPRRPRKPRKPRPVVERTPDPTLATSTGGTEAPTDTGGSGDRPSVELHEDVAAAGTMILEESLVVEEAVDVVVEGDVVVEESIVLEEPEVAEPDPLLEPSSPLLARAFSGVARTDGPRRRSRRNGTAHPPPESSD
jgi:hypothetical protein